MTVNELTKTLKAKGYRMDRLTLWSYIVFNYVTYTEYGKDGKIVMETERVKGAGEEKVVFIDKHFEEELKEIGIEVGIILK